MDGFGSEDLFNVLDDKPSDKKRPTTESPSPAEKKLLTPEVLGLLTFCN